MPNIEAKEGTLRCKFEKNVKLKLKLEIYKTLFGVYKKLIVQMVRHAIHTQIAALNFNIAFVDRWLQLHVIFGSFDVKSMVL